uniref:DUF4116 domain-containing protein n=1 Tax=unclassified Endozoicomonas TaxID=2644528 RepID=UPI0021488F26
LTDQNARLLAFFASGGGLGCLANPIKLSMSPQRLNLLAETCDSVKRLVHGAEALLDGCQAFLQLAGKSRSHRVKSFRHELPQLINRFQMLKKTIESGLKSIILPVQAAEEGQLSPGIFRQWVADCHQLQSCLQALNPDSAEQVRSVHELIFSLHQRFVEVLAPVALASGQGRLSRKDRVTYVDCRAPGKPDDKAPILRQSCKTSIKALGCSGTVISMDEAVIVNLNLGSHVSLIELLENAEGGKGRTLRLKFSDDFDRTDNDEKSGKFRRMWFLAQLLKEVELDKNADSMKLSCNAVAGEMNIECSRMRSPETMQHAFEKLIIVLRAMCNLDIELKGRPIFEGGQWDFNLLAQRLNPDVATEADRFAFQHCLFAMSYQNKSTFSKTAPCCRLLSKHHQQFAHYAHRFGMYHLSLDRGRKPKESEQEILMSAEMSEDIRRELLHHFLLFYPVSAVRLIEQVYDIGNQCFVINPSRNYRLEFYVPPGQPLGDHKEKIRNTLLKHGLEYASQRVRNDKNFVLPAFSGDPCELGDLSEELKNDSDVVKAAIAKCPLALRYASIRLRDDKNIIRMAIAESIYPLSYASQKVLEDRQCMLDLIEINPQAFNYAVSGLKGDTAFIEAAKQRNPQLRQYLR